MKASPRQPRLLPRLLAAGALCLLAAPAFAAGLYRCSGRHGELAYTNKPAGYSNCVQVAGYHEAPRAAAETVAKGNADTAGKWSYAEAAAEEAPSSSAQAPSVPTGEDKPRVLRGAVYKVVKANGVTEYTNIKPGGRYQVLFTYMATCYACDLRSKVNFGTIALNVRAYKNEIAAAAKDFGLDESLLRAVIHAESAFNPNALSMAGAQGLMQLMPGTAGDLGVANPFDAGQNIRGGAQYLASLLKNYAGDERRALAAYNAGPANVDKYGGVPPFDETQVYVDRVAVLRERYKKLN